MVWIFEEGAAVGATGTGSQRVGMMLARWANDAVITAASISVTKMMKSVHAPGIEARGDGQPWCSLSQSVASTSVMRVQTA